MSNDPAKPRLTVTVTASAKIALTPELIRELRASPNGRLMISVQGSGIGTLGPTNPPKIHSTITVNTTGVGYIYARDLRGVEVPPDLVVPLSASGTASVLSDGKIETFRAGPTNPGKPPKRGKRDARPAANPAPNPAAKS